MPRCNKKEKERLLGIEPNYLLEDKFFEPDYLRFRSDEDNILYIKKNASYNGRPDLWYSYNKTNWVEVDVFPFHIDLPKGKYVYFKGDNKRFNTSTSYYISFDSEKEIYCSGDIMTLLGVENFSHDDSYKYCFHRLFYNFTNLLTAPKLTAKVLSKNCYSYMFQGCTSLVTAPKLPALDLDEFCYEGMFFGCTSLVTVSALPSTTATGSCYRRMFQGCTSLTTTPALPATTLGIYCYQEMFKDCTSLTTIPELPATTLALSCYESMFENCASLTGVSNLPATTFSDRCYYGMFSNTNIMPDVSKIDFNDQTTIDSGVCRGLFRMTNVTYNYLYNILPKDNNDNACLPLVAPYCYDHMFSGCELLTKAPKLPATVLNGQNITECKYCYQYMFQGCTTLVDAPELPATNYIAEGCYQYMFYGCTSLTTAPELPAIYVQEYSYAYMFYGCTALVNPPSDLPCTYSVLKMYSYMFYGCISLEESPILHVGALGNRCFYHMFEGCSSLKKVTTYYTSFSSHAAENWLKNVAQSGDFYDLGNANDWIPTGWTRHTTLE